VLPSRNRSNGGVLPVGLPFYRYSLPMTRSLLFRYMTLGNWSLLIRRRIAGKPRRNITLHLSVIFGILSQLATVFVPGLRVLWGRELPDALGFVWVASAILLSWGVAETYGPLAATPRARVYEYGTNSKMKLAFIRRIFVAIAGFTVLLIGLALIVLPGPAFVVIPLGLAILATEFVWARALLKKARGMLPTRQEQPVKNSSPFTARQDDTRNDK
jgi:hypothetical protein